MNAALVLGIGGLGLLALVSSKSNAAAPASVLERVAAVLATGNPTLMRAEAAALLRDGYSEQAADLLRAAAQLDGRNASGSVLAPSQLVTTLKRGSTGPEVERWQAFLRAQGYSNVVVDGIFGVQTEDATKAFQRAKGLKADGIVGPDTLRASASAAPATQVAAPSSAPIPAPKPAPLPAPVLTSVPAPVTAAPAPKPAPASTTSAAQPVVALPAAPRTLKRDMRGADVAAWQAFLRTQAYSVLVDSVFGVETEDATKSFQSKRGIKADGIVGPETLLASTKPAPAPAASSAPAPAAPVNTKPVTVATPTVALPPPPRTIKRGDNGADVLAWQNFLRAQGYTNVAADSIFGVQTEDATKSFQRARAIKADGIVGPETVKASLTPGAGMAPKPASSAPAPAPAAAPAAAPLMVLPTLTRNLKVGLTGEDVRAWQNYLRAAKVYTAAPITADGIFGAVTDTATRVFQTQRKLTADGIVGPATWAAAQAAPVVRVAGDLQLVADSPLPGLVPTAAPREVDVSPDRALAAKLALHLTRTEQGKEDRELVKAFQLMRGLNPTGAYGPGTAKVLIRFGLVPPLPFYWPSASSQREKNDYRRALLAEAARDPARAPEWLAAASKVEHNRASRKYS